MSPKKISLSDLPTTVWIDVALIAVAGFLFVLTLDYPRMAALFPQLVLVMIVAVTAADALATVRSGRDEAGDAEASDEDRGAARQTHRKVALVAGLMVLFYVFMMFFGVVLGTLLFVILAGKALGYRHKVSLVLASLVITASVYLIFQVIMKTYLPEGYLFTALGRY